MATKAISVKMVKARKVFEKEYVKEDHERKVCIQRFMKDCKMSRAYAATAYQTLKSRWNNDEW